MVPHEVLSQYEHGGNAVDGVAKHDNRGRPSGLCVEKNQRNGDESSAETGQTLKQGTGKKDKRCGNDVFWH